MNRFWRQLLVAALIIMGAQLILSKLLIENMSLMRDLIGHAFIFSITGLGYMVYTKMKGKYLEYSGYIFGGISLLKMMLSAVFLMPFVLKKGSDELVFVCQFMGIYLIYLSLEVRMLLRDLNNNQ